MLHNSPHADTAFFAMEGEPEVWDKPLPDVHYRIDPRPARAPGRHGTARRIR